MSKVSKAFRKTVRKDVMNRLSTSLGDLETLMGKRQFRKRLKKASKTLTSKVKSTLPKEPVLQLPAATTPA